MGDFNRGSGGSGRERHKPFDRSSVGRSSKGSGARFRGSRGGRSNRGSGGRFDRGSRDRPSKKMHRVTCDKCGTKCEVPFNPTEGKPVYCSDCFGKDGKSGSDLKQVNEKLDKIMKAMGIE